MTMFMQTDFPVPVAPAMRRCGARARSMQMVRPEMFLPRRRGSCWVQVCHCFSSIMPRMETLWRTVLGTSMPMSDSWGMGVRMRMRVEARSMQMLCSRLVMRSTRTCGSTLILNSVTCGPWTASTTVPSMLNASRTLCSFWRLSWISLAEAALCSSETRVSSRSVGGRT